MLTEFGAPDHMTERLQAENGPKADEFERIYLGSYQC